jgi:hypothetical protein
MPLMSTLTWIKQRLNQPKRGPRVPPHGVNRYFPQPSPSPSPARPSPSSTGCRAIIRHLVARGACIRSEICLGSVSYNQAAIRTALAGGANFIGGCMDSSGLKLNKGGMIWCRAIHCG